MERKKTITGFGILFFLVLAAAFFMPQVSAETQLLCLSKGEKVEFSKCNPVYKDYICKKTSCINICVTKIESGIYCPSYKCEGLGFECTYLSDPVIDKKNLTISLKNPIRGKAYSQRSIDLQATMSKISTLYYIDNLKQNAKWIYLCSKCTSYNRKITFSEGNNSITLKAVDLLGNTIFESVDFFIDTKKPRIIKTEPTKGFASDTYYVEFQEDNPILLNIIIGNSNTGFIRKEVKLNNCILDQKTKRTSCAIDLNMTKYNGQIISYYFNLTDIVGSSFASKPVTLEVDSTLPKINSISHTLKGRTATFTINTTEKNFYKIIYRDSADPKGLWKTFCTSIKNGVCAKSISLSFGEHIIDFQIQDRAGNSISQPYFIIV